MAKTKISQFDATASNNTDLNSISIAEGTAPSNINNAIRELMSQLADLNLGNEVLSTLKIDNLHLDGNTIVTLDTNGDLNLTPNGTGAVTIAKADINGGTIDGTPIGASSASTGAFSTLSASSTANLGSTVTISGGNIDGVIGANTPAAITGTVITANTNFAGNLTGNVTGTVDGVVGGTTPAAVTGTTITANTKFVGAIDGNVTATSGTSQFNNVTINGTLDMDSTTSQTITGLATPSGSTDAATKGYVDTEVSGLVDSAPAALNTLNELAAALGDDASFSTTVTNSIAAKLPLAGGTMTGDIDANSNTVSGLKAPSSANDATTKTYVDTADALKLNLSGGTLSGNLAMGSNKVTGLDTPTATGDATTKGYVDGILGSATAAATSASAASTSQTAAATSATASATSATASASSATSAAASYDAFDDRYLGAKGSAPTVDNDGDALLTGALYFNTSSNQLFIWSGSAWTQAAFTASGFLSGANNLSDVANAGTSRTNLGLAIGTNVQAFDADLSAIAGLTSAADKGIQFTGSGTAGVYDLTAAGKALLDDADAAAQRTTLGLGTAATTASTDYATAAQGTKADNAAAKASNLSDLASASTARTNLGLGTAATLTAGTSATNAVQLDSNAKLPAVDGSQLTGISGGTDQIDMVVNSSSDAVTVGNVVTRESNGETAKVKKTTTTQNLSFGAATTSTALTTSSYDLGGSYGANKRVWQNCAVANDSGKYVIVHSGSTSSHGVRFQIYEYDSASSTWYDRSAGHNYQGSDPSQSSGKVTVNQTYDYFYITPDNLGGSANIMELRWHKNMNSAEGGTYMVFYDYHNSAGNIQRYAHPFTISSSNIVKMYSRLALLRHPDYSNDDHMANDSSVISMGTDEMVVVACSQWYMYYNYPYQSHFVISTRRLTYNSSNSNPYSTTTLSDQKFTSINGQGSMQTQQFSIRTMYDYTNDRLGVAWVDTNIRHRYTCWTNTGSSSSYTWTPQYTEQLLSDYNGNVQSHQNYRLDQQKADGKGRVLYTISHKYNDGTGNQYKKYFFCIAMGASSLTVQTVQQDNYGSNSTYTDSGNPTLHYDYLNDIYIVPRGSLAQSGSSQNMSVYSPSGTGITQTTNVSGGGQSGAIQVGNMLAIVDTMSISSFTNANAGKWLQINSTDSNVWKNTASFGTDGGDTYYASGNIPHTLTTHSTNKALAFGFAQKAGSAGNTISVLPFDSESIEQNQSSLTHGTKYYVSSTGALSTATTPDSDINADVDNPFVGQAIHTTNLRLPSKEVAGVGGEDSRIFCGSYDFRVDGSSTEQNVLISLPSGYTAANVRAYEINYYGIGFAEDGDQFTFKPYNGTSSVLSGNNIRLNYWAAYYGSNRNANSKDVSAGLTVQRGYLSGDNEDAYSGNDIDNPKQNYDNNSGHGGQLNGRAIYTNSLKNGSYSYSSSWRFGSQNTKHVIAHGVGSSGDSNTTTNYADGFYFYVGNDSQAEQSVAIMEGVVSVYAIIG